MHIISFALRSMHHAATHKIKYKKFAVPEKEFLLLDAADSYNKPQTVFL
jgi:hypothetical protein